VTDTWNVDSNKDRTKRVAKFEGNYIDDFCRFEGRFRSQFDKDGNPSGLMLGQAEDNLKVWDQLRKNAGI